MPTTTKVYVGNLRFDAQQHDVEVEFSKFGKIVECTMMYGFAFVKYEREDDAQFAVEEMDSCEWQGRRLKVALSTSQRNKADGSYGGGRGRGSSEAAPPRCSRNLFVANIAPQVKMRELDKLFEQFGRVLEIKILPQANRNGSLCAFVDFESVASAEKANTTKLMLMGQYLRTDYSTSSGLMQRGAVAYEAVTDVALVIASVTDLSTATGHIRPVPLNESGAHVAAHEALPAATLTGLANTIDASMDIAVFTRIHTTSVDRVPALHRARARIHGAIRVPVPELGPVLDRFLVLGLALVATAIVTTDRCLSLPSLPSFIVVYVV